MEGKNNPETGNTVIFVKIYLSVIYSWKQFHEPKICTGCSGDWSLQYIEVCYIGLWIRILAVCPSGANPYVSEWKPVF